MDNKEIVLTENGKTEYSIVIPAAASMPEQTAARELQEYLEKATGATLPIRQEEEAVGKAFYIGHTQYAVTAGICANAPEHWLIHLHEGNVILTGGCKADDRGSLYAVYHFLEDVIGVRWWNRWEEDVPEWKKLALEAELHKEGTPAFPYRKILSQTNVENCYYEARNRGNVVMIDDNLENGVLHESVIRTGGALHMGRPDHVHTLDQYIPPEEYFEKHPDWFAWNDVLGERISYGHYCLVNEEFYEEILRKLTGYIEEDQVFAAEHGIDPPCFYSISFPDRGEGYCQCEGCKKLRERSGLSGYALYLVNKLVRAVADKYPWVKIETLAYAHYLEPPKDDTIPEKNVIIRLAQVWVDLIHDIHARGNQRYLQVLQEWSEICKKAGCELYIWEYMYQLFFDVPLPIAYRLGDTFRAFYEYGVTGIFVENEVPTADFWDLNQYLLLHLSENPYADTEWLIQDFMKRYYGPAAEAVNAYLEELKRAATENDYSSYCVEESAHFNFVDAGAVQKGMVYLEEAARKAGEDPVLQMRVAWQQMHLNSIALLKYFDLQHQSESQGGTFAYDREAMRQQILETIDRAKELPQYRGSKERLENRKKFFAQMVLEEEQIAPLPAELAAVPAEDIYQFHFHNLCFHVSNAKRVGFSVVEDPLASLGKTARLSGEEATGKARKLILSVTQRSAKSPKPLALYIQQNDEIVLDAGLYKEDLKTPGYYLYRVGEVAGIQSFADTRVYIFGTESVSLSGIAAVFPMDACEVYLSARFTGPMYGGKEAETNAIFLDRIIVVRK